MNIEKLNPRVWLRDWLRRPTASELKELKRLQDEVDLKLQDCLSSNHSFCSSDPRASVYPELTAMSHAMAEVSEKATGIDLLTERYAEEVRAYRDRRPQGDTAPSQESVRPFVRSVHQDERIVQ